MHFFHETYIDCSLFFALFFLSVFFICFACFFATRFRDRFLITFLKEKGTNMTSKIYPRGDTFDQKGSKNLRPLPTGPFLESTFFRAACFLCFLIHFRRPFSQCWALLAPFGPFWAPCWALLAPFWKLFGRSWLNFARNK